MSEILNTLKSRISAHEAKIRQSAGSTITSKVKQCEERLAASLIETLEPAAREYAHVRFLGACEGLEKLVKAFEAKQPKHNEQRKSNTSQLTDEELVKFAMRKAEINRTMAQYKADYDRRIKELESARENLTAKIPAEQVNEFSNIVNLVSRSGMPVNE